MANPPNPYLLFALGVLSTLFITFLGWFFILRNRKQDQQLSSKKGERDDSRQATEKLAAELATERKETARNVQVDQKAEAARVEADRKETASKLEGEHRRLVEEVRVIKVDLAVLIERVGKGHWERLQAEMSASLHHPEEEFKEGDALLELLVNGTISQEDRARLKVLMGERMRDMRPKISDLERLTASLIHLVMDQVEKDSQEQTILSE